MALSLFLAQFLGMYLIITGIIIFLRLKDIPRIAEEIYRNKSFLFILGPFVIILGLFLVLVHNVWTPSWQVIITILAWLTLIKGILMMVLEEDKLLKIMKKLFTKKIITIVSFVYVIFGIYLASIGFNL